MRLKKFRVYYTAELRGSRVVEAVDEADAEEQVAGTAHIDDFNHDSIYLEDVEAILLEEKPRKKRGAG